MWQTIDSLRRQQNSVKQSVAFFTALSITGFIVVSWFVFYNPGVDPEMKKDANDLISPIAALKQSVSAGVSELGDNFIEAKKITETIAAMSLATTSTSTPTSTTKEPENISTTTEEI